MRVPIIEMTILNPLEVEAMLKDSSCNIEVKNLIKQAVIKCDKASILYKHDRFRFYPTINTYDMTCGVWLD